MEIAQRLEAAGARPCAASACSAWPGCPVPASTQAAAAARRSAAARRAAAPAPSLRPPARSPALMLLDQQHQRGEAGSCRRAPTIRRASGTASATRPSETRSRKVRRTSRDCRDRARAPASSAVRRGVIVDRSARVGGEIAAERTCRRRRHRFGRRRSAARGGVCAAQEDSAATMTMAQAARRASASRLTRTCPAIDPHPACGTSARRNTYTIVTPETHMFG